MKRRERVTPLDYALRALAAGYLLALLGAVVAYKAAFVHLLTIDPILTVYGLVVSIYIISRFALSLLYRPARANDLTPTIAVVTPAFNEEAAIAASLRSILAVDYPVDKLEIVAVNDGSTDGTLAALEDVARTNPRVQVISFTENHGKRAAMAAGIRSTTAEVVAFVDSDSSLEPDAMRRIVRPLADPKVGAVCGHADVLNVEETWLTRMQAVRYYVAFRVVKAAESIFGAVTCCSGCFSAYRREAIMPRLDWWENQRFLGLPSTFGDDRSLTNCVLRDWRVRYQADAVPWWTAVADYVATMPNTERFILGLQLYGMDWPAAGGPANPGVAFEYDDIQAQRTLLGTTPIFDPIADAPFYTYTDGAGVPHTVWYTDATTQATRIQLARQRGVGGIAFWRLGREDQRLWDNPVLGAGVAWP